MTLIAAQKSHGRKKRRGRMFDVDVVIIQIRLFGWYVQQRDSSISQEMAVNHVLIASNGATAFFPIRMCSSGKHLGGNERSE